MNENKSFELYIRCDGGEFHGMGHVSRCIEIANKFIKKFAVRANFLMNNIEGIEKVEKNNFHCHKIDNQVAKDLDQVLNLLTRDIKKPILILDNKLANENYTRTLSKVCFLVCIDDNDANNLVCDVLINYNCWLTSKSDLNYKNSQTGYLIGMDYLIINDKYIALFEERRLKPQKENKKLTVMITMGGEDPDDMTSWVIDSLSHSMTDLYVIVVIGAGHPDPVRVQSNYKKNSFDGEVHINTKDMDKLMLKTDICITACGTTVYELAAAGIPQIGVVIDEHQEKLANYMENIGCLAIGGDYRVKDKKKMVKTFSRYINDKQQRFCLSEKSRELNCRSGVENIINNILKDYH